MAGARVLQSKAVTAVVHGCSFVPGANCEGGVLGRNAECGLVMYGKLASSTTFAASQDSVSTETLTLGRIQTLSFSTVFIDYS